MNISKYLLVITFFSSAAFGQNNKWSTASKWKLYSSSPKNLDSFSMDSVTAFPFAELNQDSINQFLNVATLIPTERTVGAVWMGAPYWVSYEKGGSLYLLKISTYGGFFVDNSDGFYYELPVEERAPWLNYFSHQSILIQSRKYPNP
jgi:hypothetical protein